MKNNSKEGETLEPLTAQQALEFCKKLLAFCEKMPNSGIYYKNVVLSLGYLYQKDAEKFVKMLTPGEPEKPKVAPIKEGEELKTFDNLGKDGGIVIDGTTVYSKGGAECESCPG